ncbi:MAG: hypothetical protein Q7K16_00120 [Candidatus Azambacteria bacterium]|nr:hypothetical protein [Candidatus Azambacteria bacterium]
MQIFLFVLILFTLCMFIAGGAMHGYFAIKFWQLRKRKVAGDRDAMNEWDKLLKISMKVGYIVIGSLIALLIATYWFYSTLDLASHRYVCAKDAKQCPDGSYVGRTGPKCEFSACPELKSDFNQIDASTWKTYRNEKYGFEMLIPSEFTISSSLEHCRSFLFGPMSNDGNDIAGCILGTSNDYTNWLLILGLNAREKTWISEQYDKRVKFANEHQQFDMLSCAIKNAENVIQKIEYVFCSGEGGPGVWAHIKGKNDYYFVMVEGFGSFKNIEGVNIALLSLKEI